MSAARLPERILTVPDPERTQILLTNDDGIRSPGLWAAAEALSTIGYVTVAAPRDQASGSGRSMPVYSDGSLREEQVTVNGQTWSVHAVGGSPAQTVQHGIYELMPRFPDLVVAGINYGENVSTSITISGTVGAALEGAAMGIPSIAISLELERGLHQSYSEEVDFSVAADFGVLFAKYLLSGNKFEDVDVLKIDVPNDATKSTPWQITHLERSRYYHPIMPERGITDEPGAPDYELVVDFDGFSPGSDAYALRVDRAVSITPLSLDLTSRLDLTAFEESLRGL